MRQCEPGLGVRPPTVACGYQRQAMAGHSLPPSGSLGVGMPQPPCPITVACLRPALHMAGTGYQTTYRIYKSENCTKALVVTDSCHQPDGATGWVVVAAGSGDRWLWWVVVVWRVVLGGGRGGGRTASIDTTGCTPGFAAVVLQCAQVRQLCKSLRQQPQQ